MSAMTEQSLTNIEPSPPVLPAEHGWNGKVAALLLLATVIGSVLILPYALSLMRGTPPVATAIGTVIQDLIFSLIAVTLGLKLGDQIGLGAPELRAWVAGDRDAGRRIARTLPLALGLGLAAGAVITVIGFGAHAMLPAPKHSITVPPAWQGLLASISAGVREEIWLRFGVMTLLVWIATRIARQQQAGGRAVWTGNVLAALLFGAMHLPGAFALFSPGPWAVAVIVGENALAGLVFGWLYWKRGLVAAMTGHFATDLILHVALAL